MFICIHFACVRAHVYMLSAVSQCARRGPVYLVFITKPFTEAPIRIKPLSAHTDHRTQPGSVCVCVCVRVSVCVSVRERDTGVRGKGDYFAHVCIVYCLCVHPACMSLYCTCCIRCLLVYLYVCIQV